MFDLADGRRPAGYVVASTDSKAFDDPGVFIEIPLVNRIRPRVRQWRENGYPGVSGITQRLLTHWNDPEEFAARQFFFCQLEAAETLIWLTEAPPADRVGVEAASDGGTFARLCAKMATGTGKTVVMAMIVAWQVLNKVSYPQDTRFSKHVLVIAPGLTVRSRLAVLEPSHTENYYEAFRVVPASLRDKLLQGRVRIRNWHALNWETEERIAGRRSVDKRGARSDEAYVRDVLGEMANVAQHPRDQRRGAPCLAGPRRVEDQRSREGRNRGRYQVDRWSGSDRPDAPHSDLLRLLRHAVRTIGQTEF